MKVNLVSFNFELTSSEKRNSLIEIFNNSKSDLLLFAGHTLNDISDIEKIRDKIDNKSTVAFFEVKNFGARELTNWAFKIENNKILSCHTHQIFTDSSEINKNKYCAEQLLHELTSNRKFTVKDKRISLLVCGEINILKNIQSEDNRVEFRVQDKELRKSFDSILAQTDIFLNPLHTPMGNQGKMEKRRTFLSAKGKAYFSAANMDNEAVLENRKLHYAFANGNEIVGEILKSTPKYIVREYQIKS
ncbi:hypothetical protein [Rufibacter sp. XAAS-G3-1]|uniref:hypothetical protein n=1 Tax=Rufibacter sp. XAAS-G3-1 TaxID=2729134 RepID=UPI0015E6C860|nr:hypothetical protein [Rufibacter sp. XAAS-G3-1]